MIRVLIAGPTARIVDDIEKLEPHREAIDVCGIAHQPSEILDEARLRLPDVLLLHDGFIELPPGDLAGQIEPLSPATRVLLVTSRGDAGAGTTFARIVDDEADGQELLDAIVRAAERTPAGATGGDDAEPEPPSAATESARSRAHSPTGRATVVVVFSPNGGAGTSMLAANLAVALAAGGAARVALVDTDLQFGDAAAMLHIESHPLSIADLAQHGDDIEAGLLDDVLATGPGDVRVLRSPASPELSETIGAAGLRSIIRAIAKEHDVVVVDTPSHLDERTLELFDLADRLLLVIDDSARAFRRAGESLRLLEALSIDRDRIDVVLNHSRPRANHRLDSSAELLDRGALAELPYDARLDAAIDAGTPIVHSIPRAELSRGIVAVAGVIRPQTADARALQADVSTAPRTPIYRRRFSLGRR